MIHSAKSDETRICLRTAGILTGIFLAALAGPAACGADPTAPPLPALSQALAQTELRKDGVFLAVGADKVKLPPDAVLPAPGGDISAITNAYGQIQLSAGAVTAITPPTMTVVYAPPETPNPYDGMPPSQVLKLLAATFSAAQWETFLGPGGVGYAEKERSAFSDPATPKSRVGSGNF